MLSICPPSIGEDDTFQAGTAWSSRSKCRRDASRRIQNNKILSPEPSYPSIFTSLSLPRFFSR